MHHSCTKLAKEQSMRERARGETGYLCKPSFPAAKWSVNVQIFIPQTERRGECGLHELTTASERWEYLWPMSSHGEEIWFHVRVLHYSQVAKETTFLNLVSLLPVYLALKFCPEGPLEISKGMHRGVNYIITLTVIQGGKERIAMLWSQSRACS